MGNEEWERQIDLNTVLKSQAIIINRLSELCEDLIKELIKYRNMDETKEIFDEIKKGCVVL